MMTNMRLDEGTDIPQADNRPYGILVIMANRLL